MIFFVCITFSYVCIYMIGAEWLVIYISIFVSSICLMGEVCVYCERKCEENSEEVATE
jgi:hypothetical protein